MIREGVTIHRGSEKEQGLTRIGSNNLLMVNVHVAHDCVLEDRIIIANNTILGGHCHVESFVTISGGVGIHPFVSIGSYGYVGALSRIYHDVPRYMIVDGNPSKVRCINVVGLRRHGISSEAIAALARGTPADLPSEDGGQSCRGDSGVTRSSLPRGTQPAGLHRDPAPRQARPRPGTLENDMTRLRVGVVGVGHLGQHHARILAAMPDVELVAVADSRPEQAQAVAAKCGTAALDDYRLLLGSVDAVTVAVPTFLHREVAGAFLARGNRHFGREADGRLRPPSPNNLWHWRAQPTHCCKSATSSDSTLPSGAGTVADPPQIRECRATLDLHIPFDRHRGRPGPDDSRP